MAIHIDNKANPNKITVNGSYAKVIKEHNVDISETDNVIWSQPLTLGIKEASYGSISVRVEPSTGYTETWSILYPEWSAPIISQTSTFTPTNTQQMYLIAPVTTPSSFPVDIDITSASYPDAEAPFIWNIVYSAAYSTANKIRITYTGCRGLNRSSEQSPLIYMRTVEVKASDLLGANSYANRIVLIPGSTAMGQVEFYYEGSAGDWSGYHFIQHKQTANSLNWYIHQVESAMSFPSPFPNLSEPNDVQAAGARTDFTTSSSTSTYAQAYYGDLVVASYVRESETGYDYAFQYFTAQCYNDTTPVGSAWDVTSGSKWQLNKNSTLDYNSVKFSLNFTKTEHMELYTIYDSYDEYDPGLYRLGIFVNYDRDTSHIVSKNYVNYWASASSPYSISQNVSYFDKCYGIITIGDDYFPPEGFAYDRSSTLYNRQPPQGFRNYRSNLYYNRTTPVSTDVCSYASQAALFSSTKTGQTLSNTSPSLILSANRFDTGDACRCAITEFSFTYDGKNYTRSNLIGVNWPFSTKYATEDGVDPAEGNFYRYADGTLGVTFSCGEWNQDVTLYFKLQHAASSVTHTYSLKVIKLAKYSDITTFTLTNFNIKCTWYKLVPCQEV